MPVAYEVINFASRTTVGTQTISHSLGVSPQAAFLISGSATANDGTPTIHAILALGWWDGTNYACMNVNSYDNVAVSWNNKIGNTNSIGIYSNKGQTTVDEVQVDSVSSSDVVLDFIAKDTGSAGQSILILFAGLDMLECDTTAVSDNTTTTTSSQADAIMGMYYDDAFDDTSRVQFGGFAVGALYDDGAGNFPQVAIQGMERDSQADGEPQGMFADETGSGSNGWMNEWSAGIDYGKNIDAIGSSNFTWRAVGTNTAQTIATVAFGMPAGKGVYVGADESPNSTGNQSITGVGFRPGLVIFFYGNYDATNTERDNTYAGSLIGSYGLGASDGTNDWTVSTFIENDVATSNTGSICDSDVIHVMDSGGGSTDAAATLSSMDPDGFTLNWATVDGTNNFQYGFIAFEAAGIVKHRRRMEEG